MYQTFLASASQAGYFLSTRLLVGVYFQIDWFVRDTWLLEIKFGRGTVYKNSSNLVTMDGVEWKHTRIAGKFTPQEDGLTWIKLNFKLNSGILAYNDVKWSIRSGLVASVEGDVYSGPRQQEGEISTLDPWLGRYSMSERDEEDVAEGGGATQVETAPLESDPSTPTPTYVGPASANYKVYTSLGADGYYYSLYHELLNRYTYRSSAVWVLNSPSQGAGASMYSSTPNGDGWLDLSKTQPSWDAGTWHPIFFSSKGGNTWAIGDGAGRYLAWGNTPSVGQYAGAVASFALVFTTDLNSALSFDFVFVA